MILSLLKMAPDHTHFNGVKVVSKQNMVVHFSPFIFAIWTPYFLSVYHNVCRPVNGTSFFFKRPYVNNYE